MYKVFSILLLLTFNLFSQEISFSEKKLEYFFNPVYFPEYDSIVVYNSGSSLLVIDSIYSRNWYGYRLLLDSILSDQSYYVYTGYDSLYIAIESNDSIKLIFSYPDFCPICKNSLKINAFSDTLIFYSNSLINNYSYIPVEGDGSTDVKEDNISLDDFVLSQNYPNPFNPITKINYFIPKTSLVSLKIYDLMGREIKTLNEGEQINGTYSVTWDGTNDENKKVSSSIYFYKLETKENKIIRKMVLIK